MRVSELLSETRFPLPRSSSARLDKELLLSKALQCSKAELYIHDDQQLTVEQMQRWQRSYQRRLQGEPIAYILGWRDFWSLRLRVNHHVLIPRPETEELVALVLREMPSPDARLVADLGTGSGAVAIALARERPCWQLVATDLSRQTLAVAQYNAKHWQVAQQISFKVGQVDSWLAPLAALEGQFDAIVANPPYIAAHDPHLTSLLPFEPRSALVADHHGLADLFAIIQAAPSYLKPGGLLALEHGADQAAPLHAFWRRCSAGYGLITLERDSAGLPRLSWARLNKKR